jgi:hypothetical protein
VVAKVRERLALSNQTMHVERFNLKILNEVEGKEQYHVEISNRFTDLEILTQRWILIDLGKLLERI